MGSYEDTIAVLETELAAIPGRPAAYSDDLSWILVASGRAESSDNRLPLIG